MMDEHRLPERGRDIIDSLPGRYSRRQIIEIEGFIDDPGIARPAESASAKAIGWPTPSWLAVCGSLEEAEDRLKGRTAGCGGGC